MNRPSICFTLCLLAAACFLAACGAERQEPLPPPNPMGLSGKMNPEAEKKFAQARVLWRGDQDRCSDPRQAVALLDDAVKLAPDCGDCYARRGLAKIELGRHDEAFDDLTLAIRLHPTAEAYAFRGLASLRAGNETGAAKDLDRSLEINPSQQRAWNYYGDLKLAGDDKPAACGKYEEACSNGDCSRLEKARAKGICE